MAGTPKLIASPAYLSNSVANIYAPPASTIYTIIRHIHLVNVTASSATFSLYVGATGGSTGGTQLFGGQALAANTPYDYYCQLLLLSTQFLTGVCSASSTIVITVEGEQGVV